ncbi:MAG: hypothetical protein ABFS23_08970, partial [Pseudomonadota bacterium]
MKTLFVEAEGLPDIAGARDAFALGSELADKDVAKVLFHRELQPDRRFLPPQLRRLAVLVVLTLEDDSLHVTSWDLGRQDEAGILEQLHRLMDRPGTRALAWDDGRDMGAWLRIRTLVNRGRFAGTPLEDLEAALGARQPVSRPALCARLGIGATPLLDDAANWDTYSRDGMDPLVERCRRNVCASASLWVRWQGVLGRMT